MAARKKKAAKAAGAPAPAKKRRKRRKKAAAAPAAAKPARKARRKRAKKARVSLRSDSMIGTHFVEVRGPSRPEQALSTERPESPYRSRQATT